MNKDKIKIENVDLYYGEFQALKNIQEILSGFFCEPSTDTADVSKAVLSRINAQEERGKPCFAAVSCSVATNDKFLPLITLNF